MHGRDDTVLEQQFMAKSMTGYTSKPFGPGADRFMLQPYGRYTNASRFAGETDGLEAIESVAKTIRSTATGSSWPGFSMGGASAWSYIVHFADRWAAGAPGAGFTETEVFLRGALVQQPQNAVQQTLWHMYDSTDYAMNTFNVPVVAYSGGNRRAEAGGRRDGRGDAQGRTHARAHHRPEHRPRLRAGRATAAPGPPGSARCQRARIRVPKEIRFTTWMLRYNRMFWLTVDAMEEEWQRARVDARIDGNAIDCVDDDKCDGAAPRLRAWAGPFRGRHEAARRQSTARPVAAARRSGGRITLGRVGRDGSAAGTRDLPPAAFGRCTACRDR